MTRGGASHRTGQGRAEPSRAMTAAGGGGVRHRLTREERRQRAREILARLDARRDAEQLRQPPQLELFTPERSEDQAATKPEES